MINTGRGALARAVQCGALLALVLTTALPAGSVAAATPQVHVERHSPAAVAPADTFYTFVWLNRLIAYPGVNQRTAAGLVPIDFTIGGNRGLDIIPAGWPHMQQFDCSTGNVIPGTVESTKRPVVDGFTYFAADKRYRYFWQTTSAFSDTCELFSLRLNDGTTHTLRFRFAPFAFVAPTKPWNALNEVVPGGTVSISFRMGPGAPDPDELAADGFPQSRPIDCADSERLGPPQATAPTGRGSFSRSGLIYTYRWQTDASWSDTCRRFQILLRDGTIEVARFGFDGLPLTANDQGAGFSTDEDTAFTTTSLLANDSDPNGEPLTVTRLHTRLTLGSATLNSDGTLDYDPGSAFQYLGAGEHVTDVVGYTACDPQGGCSSATAVIVVNGINDAPTDISLLPNHVSEMRPPNTLVGTLTAADVDASDGHTFTLVSGTETDNALFTITGNKLRTAVSLNYNDGAVRQVQVQTKDGHGGTLTKVLTVGVTDVNTGPVVSQAAVEFAEDGFKVITLRATDAEDDVLTIAVTHNPAHGTLSNLSPVDCSALNVCSRTVKYTPDADFNGSDSFTFRANDGVLNSNVGTASITVDPINDAPVANDDSVSVDKNGSTVIDLTSLVSDAETADDDLIYTIVTPPAHGNYSEEGVYSPSEENYTGPDSFQYQVTDRGDPDNCSAAPCDPTVLSSAVKTVSITVADVNNPPAVSVPEALVIYQGQHVTFQQFDNEITVSDLDVGAGVETLTVTTTAGTLSFGSTDALSDVIDSAATITASGTLGGLNAALDGLIFTPPPTFDGSVTITVTIDDNGNTGSGGNKTDSRDIVVSVSPDHVPTVFLDGAPDGLALPDGPDHAGAYTTGDTAGAAISDIDATVDDPDPVDSDGISSQIAELTASITDRRSPVAKEYLVLTSAGQTIVSDNGLTVDGGNTITLIVSGAATDAVYQDLLREIRYVNTDTTTFLDTSDRHITVQVQDGVGANSNIPTATISISNGGT